MLPLLNVTETFCTKLMSFVSHLIFFFFERRVGVVNFTFNEMNLRIKNVLCLLN